MPENRCALCGGRYDKRRVSVDLRNQREGLIAFQHGLVSPHVPAEVCNQCGDTLFAPATTHRLLQIAQEMPAPDTTIQVPVYDLAA
ncbi:MAG: YgiT-type zinc finger protein [Armatimonadetes bacterium]|nr:YgiT-type zinc finger protein [Armatimonadota bacterium]